MSERQTSDGRWILAREQRTPHGGSIGIRSDITDLKERERSFVLLLGAVACALVAFCEVIFLKDVFVDQVPRMNTVFKFYFQAWAMLSIVGGASIYFVLEGLKPVFRTHAGEGRIYYSISRLLWIAALIVFLLMGALWGAPTLPRSVVSFIFRSSTPLHLTM